MNDMPRIIPVREADAATYLRTLSEIIHSVMAGRPLGETAQITLRHLAQLIPYDRADVMRYDFDAGEIIFLASDPSDSLPLVVNGRLPLSFAGPLSASETRQIHHCSALGIFDLTSPWQRMIYAEGIRSYVLAPLHHEGDLLGAISLGAKRQEVFTPQQIDILQEVGRLLAARVQQLTLQQQLQDHAITLETRVQRRTAELQMINEQLQRANRMKDQFLAAMSHELRTPLNGLLAKAEMLQEEVYGELNQRQARAAEVITTNGHDLLSLINDILDISRLEAGATEIVSQRLAVAQLCRASVMARQDMAEAKGISLGWEKDDAVTWVCGDEQRLKQVLVSLLDNAVKFTPEGGEIGLVVTSSAEQIHFTVWDTGIGISDEQIEKLFQPFVQLDASLARKYAGTGLGLYMVRRLVDLHQGHIQVESEPGRGSRFTVSLPWSSSSSSTDTAVAPTRSLHPRRRRSIELLLAADNQTVVERTSSYLQKHGYQVAVTASHQQLREYVQNTEPDVVLIDADMLGLEGPEAVKTVRAVPELDDVPVLVQSTLTLPGDRENCLAAGADDYVAQPVAMSTLRGRIENLLHE